MFGGVKFVSSHDRETPPASKTRYAAMSAIREPLAEQDLGAMRLGSEGLHDAGIDFARECVEGK